jgi:hypothetical protein
VAGQQPQRVKRALKPPVVDKRRIAFCMTNDRGLITQKKPGGDVLLLYAFCPIDDHYQSENNSENSGDHLHGVVKPPGIAANGNDSHHRQKRNDNPQRCLEKIV